MKLEKIFILILIMFMFALPFSYANAINSQEIKYRNWTVDFFVDDIIRYSTNGTNVNGHIFGWMIKPGACDIDVLYLAISTYEENAASLKKNLNGKIIPLKVSFPEVTQIPKTFKIKTDFLSAVDFSPSLTIANFSHFHMGRAFDQRMRDFKKIKIEVDAPFSKLFDVKWDVYDLNGYIAAKEKAHEICEQNSTGRMALFSKNYPISPVHDRLLLKNNVHNFISYK
tara:strand:+ start:845 stop:1522 length:678 start_codon:yes stop_codon:yes gene_type:complete